ncbi:ABC transporter substrate-binding protein [Tritonibacter mobilis]|jgi:peptide/nickel transport system substrate-binding protein|uniref:Peptide ABC transporter substrate-binding protein n=1 Tax=Tritonibacter mobilis F1926 TaxID=1265309 RepID=A0A1B1A8K1_9RHOB|nr:ABC transporter substrate-binding protein [Tritonibacter mobilis]MCZ4268870.1 ABC transporter substrate-binding protein [Rhodobacteraceae bacterium G21628-S1]MEE2809515.1 ABC transporter substrate-binding protein [Pseudomonadota bacterium]ANP42871.1 peptide ABC transporter substrate-binding protein [Tritonibacter mobilis F1926]KJZ23303.1 peptide ABC transporter substrate-binding protein [Tritonibacter mobilis]NHM18560.1 ABC transporter substrate-binding protein [Tritonibacter mobilis]
MKTTTVLTLTSLLLASAAPLSAETLRWARSGDALTLDPHAQNEGPTHTIRHQMYEPLIIRDVTGAFEPALATEWAPKEGDPNVWVFKLREGVKFHGGEDFTAEDVVFSFNRAKQENSDMKELIGSITEVRAVDDLTVEIVTDGPNPILPSNLTNLFIMDKGWSEANNTVNVQDFEGGEITYATTHANGTGPYVLQSREPDVKTVMTLNENYWGKDQFPLDVTEIVYTPIQNPATRVAALLSGEIDFLQDMPVQDLDRVNGADGLMVRQAPQNRVIFFGLNVGAEDIEADNVDGKNPLADVRVRKAMSMAINRDAIQKVVMRGQSQPAGMIAPPFVNGWTEEMDAESKTDIEGAKALMAEAGYGDGFSIRLDCPNDRYVNDEPICQAAVGMLGQIGIKVNLDAKPKAQHFPLITDSKTDFYMLGWGVPTYDSEYVFNFLVHGREGDIGTWNNTGFDNDELDAKIKSLASNTDLDARNKDIADIWRVVQDEQLYIPIHHQVLNWGMSEKVDIAVDPEDQPKVKYFKMN